MCKPPFLRRNKTHTDSMLLKPSALRLTLLFPLFFGAFLAQSQTIVEICNNGLDDDGDGLIDCYDQDCTCTGQCDSFYYTTCNADCYYVPPCDQINLGIQWSSEAEVGTYSPLVAGDMDKDGIPDVVTYANERPDIYIIDGATGATKVHIVGPTDYPGGTAPAIADLDHDGYGELILVGNDRILRCWNHDGSLAFASTVQVGYSGRYRFSVPNIADFDHDGWAEINIGNQVFNGQTGALLAQGGPGVSAGEHPSRAATGFSFCSTVAMDVLPDSFCPDCDGLEIVAGNQVLSVNLVTGIVKMVTSAPAPFTDGFTSVADFDRDGDLDAIVQGKKGIFNTVYCWDIKTGTIMRQYQLLNNFGEGASRVNVADLNGDGQLEISFVSYPRLYALRNNFTVMWLRTTNDNSSITCSSVFDFCGDGSSDVIYRGETKLQVLEGSTGNVKWEDDCLSATHIEAPLILDVDADGQTEVVIQCGINGGSTAGKVIAYEAVGLPGIASRKVWNQHGYFNTNINDDLSVPRYQQNPGIIGDSLRMNTFMNQYFNPTFPTPDGALTFNSVTCAGDSLLLSLSICNPGDNTLPKTTPISFYQGNPQTTAALWAGTLPLGFDLLKDSCRTFTLRIARLANDSIFVVLNDNNSKPAPFNLAVDFPVTTIGECSFTNNIRSFYYAYNPPTLNIGADTAICDNGTLALNAAGNDLLQWQWQDFTTLATFTALDAGTYSVTTTDVCGITQTDQIIITIDSSTVVQIGADRTICQGETVPLSESGFDFYTWSPTTAVSCVNCPATQAGPSQSGYVILNAGFANGCMSRDSAFITVYDTANYTIDTTVCFGRTILWNTIPIPTDSSVTFFLQSIHGCDSTVQVRVTGSPIGTFSITVDTSVCINKTLAYNGFDLLPGEEKDFLLTASTGCDSLVLVKVMSKDTFATRETLVLCAGQVATIFGNDQMATGLFEMTFPARNGCDSTHTVDLTVLDAIGLQIDATPSCVGESTGSLTTLVVGSAPPFSYAWNSALVSGSQPNGIPAGNYTLTVTDARECTQTDTVTVTEYPAIVFAATSDSVRCFGEANGAIALNFTDSLLVFSLNNQPYQQTRRFQNLAAGSYLVFAQDIHGCVDTLNTDVSQPAQAIVSLPADTTLQLGDSLRIPIQTTLLAPLQYAWSDSLYLSCVDCPDPIARPLSSIRYTLVVSDQHGCKASDDLLLTVQRIIGVFMPNAIAPGSSNSYNALMTPNFGPAVRMVRMLEVYDRWGNRVHQVRNAAPDDSTLAWDGRFRGDLAQPGVYIWKMELELVDGSIEYASGDVTVVR